MKSEVAFSVWPSTACYGRR